MARAANPKVEITYNPFQGLKLLLKIPMTQLSSQVEITYNPFQGLKLDATSPWTDHIPVEITYNPFQGLKLLN